MRRDEMARAAAVYCHPRLSSITTSNTNVNFEGGGDITQIFAIPRGAAVDVRNGTVTIEGTATELSPISPYEGTPGLLTDQSEKPVPVERLPVHEIDVSNVTPMRRRDEVPDCDQVTNPANTLILLSGPALEACLGNRRVTNHANLA
jgi:hypothetical protein